MKAKKIFFSICMFILFAFAVSTPLFANFEDEVDATGDEVFLAARQVVEKAYGINRENAKKKWIESKYQEDIVKRSRGMFKNVLKQGVYRRYRLKIEIRDIEKGSNLKVKGTFQERSTGSDANLPWRTVKMMSVDHRLERELFFRILTQLEDNRKKTAVPIKVAVTSSQVVPSPAPSPSKK